MALLNAIANEKKNAYIFLRKFILCTQFRYINWNHKLPLLKNECIRWLCVTPRKKKKAAETTKFQRNGERSWFGINESVYGNDSCIITRR